MFCSKNSTGDIDAKCILFVTPVHLLLTEKTDHLAAEHECRLYALKEMGVKYSAVQLSRSII